MKTKTQRINEFLKKNGFETKINFSENYDIVDDDIEILNSLYTVQIGFFDNSITLYRKYKDNSMDLKEIKNQKELLKILKGE